MRLDQANRIMLGDREVSRVYLGANMVLGNAFSPASLFAAGEPGVWYDPSDLSTLYQDAAGTTPVTAVEQPVGRILDKSGRGNHATQATATSRPILQRDGNGKYYLFFDGVDDFLSTGVISFGSSDKVFVSAGFARNLISGNADNNQIIGFGSVNSPGSFIFEYYTNNTLVYREGSGAFGAQSSVASYTNNPTVTSFQVDLSGTTTATEMPAFNVNGVDTRGGTSYGAGDTGGGNFGAYALTIGKSTAIQNTFLGKIYQVLVRNAFTTDAEIKATDAYNIAKTSVNGTGDRLYTFTPMQFSDSGPLVNKIRYFQTSAFASVDLQTTADALQIAAYSSIYQAFPSFSEIGVYVNGVFNQSIPVTTSSVVADVFLPSGDKVVSLVNGLQSKPSTLIGSFVGVIKSSAPVTQVNLTPTNRILLYGDSITVGGNATVATRDGWGMLLRNAYRPNSVAFEAWGYRSLYDDAATTEAINAFVANLATYAPQRIWLAIGTNDYGLNKWSAASFGAAYAAVLDAIHAALPSATVICQTPLVRSSEAANSYGSTLGDYRSQIVSAQSARPSFTTFVDGTGILLTSDLQDGAHPTTSGHAKYAAYAKTILGIA